MRRDGCRVHDWHQYTCVRYFRGESTVASDDATDSGSNFACVTQGRDQVGADVVFRVSAADGKNKDRVLGPQVTPLQPVLVGGLPAIVVDARRQFRNIIGGRVALDVRDLSEVVNRVRGMSRTSAYSEKKDAPTVVANIQQNIKDLVDAVAINQSQDRAGFFQILVRIIHSHLR